jgi:aminoglycoside phosphotransferase family enzyme/predicted kinase
MDQVDEPQAPIFALLSDPATHGCRDVRRIDTHGNVVFLAGDRALKVKRAVRLPFLDYSTLEKRKAACASELAVNRVFAPQLYRRIVPITRDQSGRLTLNGEGQPVEWAVEMSRFDENQTLDRIAAAHGIDDRVAQDLAAAVVAMHARVPAVDGESWIAALGELVDQNAAAFREAPDLFDVGLATELDTTTRSQFARLRPLLLERGRRGLVRRGHGDLHLGNIALLDGRPVPFDAIEFDPNVAAGDVLYDLAFPLMDLLERGFVRVANIVFNGYFAPLANIDDLDGLAALPLFLSLRAAIRAKVTAARLQYAKAYDRSVLAEAARSYFRLAIKLISPGPPTLVAVGGLSGTGKSMLARELAPFIGSAPGALLVRSDLERKRLFGIPEIERLPVDAYGTEASERVYGAVASKAAHVITANHSVIVDAVYAKPEERAAIAKIAAKANAAFRGLFLVADLQTRIDRVGSRRLDASDATAAVALRQESFELGRIEWAQIDASGSPERTLELARTAMTH